MAKPNVDSDLYGDIYGEDATDFLEVPDDPLPEEIETPLNPVENSSTNTPAPAAKAPARTTPSTNSPTLALPAKPIVNPSPSQSPTTSYSAQVAKQFSSYTQTPAQERQPHNSSASSVRTSFAIPTVDGVGVTESGGTVFGLKPSDMHEAGKMFIGGLSWDTTDEGLRDYFQKFGKVDACTIMRDPSGTSRGFAFLTFEDPNVLQNVIGREHLLDGKSIDPKRAIPREEHVRNSRFFVGGLSPTTTSDSMRAFFTSYGKVIDATVMIDRETGRGKGFGFVTFEDAVNSNQLIGKIGLILDDKQIEVKAAQPRSQREQQGRGNGNSSGTNQDSSNNKPMTMASTMQPMNMQNAMGMLNQRFMGVPGMNSMGMNPMMGMGMGMGGMNMLNGMSPMNFMGQSGDMSSMGVFGNMGAMRMGMGAMAPMVGGMRGAGNMRMGQNMNVRSGGMNGMGRVGVPAAGPNRTGTRGQHSFHPYAR